MVERLALGTVQFGCAYGVANQVGKVAKKEVEHILGFARSVGINTLDTAIAYGDSEDVLGAIGVQEWNVITKLPAIPDGQSDVSNWVLESINQSIRRIGTPKLHGLLLHRPEQINGQHGNHLLQGLERAKSLGLIGKVGVSIYDPEQLQIFLDSMPIDIVQAPLNILDRRLIESGWASRLSSAGIEIHVRSAFLQGLLLMPPNIRPKKFDRWMGLWKIWDEWLLNHKIKPIDACIKFALSIREVNKVVIGVDSESQLRQIIETLDDGVLHLPELLNCGDVDLLNPVNWGKL